MLQKKTLLVTIGPPRPSGGGPNITTWNNECIIKTRCWFLKNRHSITDLGLNRRVFSGRDGRAVSGMGPGSSGDSPRASDFPVEMTASASARCHIGPENGLPMPCGLVFKMFVIQKNEILAEKACRRRWSCGTAAMHSCTNINLSTFAWNLIDHISLLIFGQMVLYQCKRCTDR